MRNEAGRRLDWLFEQPESQSEDTAAFLRWLQEQEQHDPRIDSLAPFLLKEQQADRIYFDPDENKWYAKNGLHREFPLERDLSKLAELLHSTRVPQAYMSPQYTIGDMVHARGSWDQEYDDDDQWGNISYPYQIDDYLEAAKKRERELAAPHQERQGLQPIVPGFDWHELARNFDDLDYGHYNPNEVQRVFDLAREHGGIAEFANSANDYINHRFERRRENFEPVPEDYEGIAPQPNPEQFRMDDGGIDWAAHDDAYEQWQNSPEYQQMVDEQFMD